SGYAANVELAEAVAPKAARSAPAEKMKKVVTPDKTRCEDVANLLGVPIEKTVKAIAIVREEAQKGASGSFAMLLVRGDHDLNEIKTQKAIGTFRFARDEEIERILKCRPGYLGPVSSVPLNLYADRTVAAMSDFVCGANEAGFHFTGVNWGRDLPEPGQIADIRKVVAGDPSPDGKGTLEIVRGIEVGHIFQLRTQYSESMKATFLDEAGNSRPFEMGCYGMGITRIVAAAIGLMLKGTGLALIGIAFPGLALAGAQIYEPLAVEVRAGLQASIADKPAPRHAFADSESAVDWLAEMSHRLEARMPNFQSRV